MIHNNIFEHRNSYYRPADAIAREKKVLDDINATFGDDYELYPNFIIQEKHPRQEVDIFVKHKGFPCFVVEVKMNLDNKIGGEVLKRNMSSCQVSYGILTDGTEYRLYAGFAPGVTASMTLENIKGIIEQNSTNAPEEVEVTIPELRNKMNECIPTLSNECSEETKGNITRATRFIASLADSDFILSTGYIEFADINNEDKFFKALVGEYDGDQMCRYTTSSSLYLTLKDSKHNMCNIVCMNDKGESSYADNYTDAPIPTREERIKEINRAFILSLSDIANEDNLTMWRLYADDAKGVCLRYERNDNVRNMENFFIAKVSYADSNTKIHYELEYVKSLMHNLQRNFKFKRWNIWKHFFKSENYVTEREVRLLYVAPENENDKNIETVWMQDNKSGIMCEMKLFNYAYSPTSNLFPLRITHIYLGPKYPEAEVSAQQIGYLLSRSKVYKTNTPYDMVHVSQINDYR